MSYYEDKASVEQYVAMAVGYDGRLLIDALHPHLADGVSVLELGMGPGKDLDLLAQRYEVTGSDFSAEFLNRYRQQQPNADLLQLDAATLVTERSFDCIYSNKVLQHLTREQLKQSFTRQAALLNDGGLLCHSFWHGDEETVAGGILHVYYTEPQLRELLWPLYKLVHFEIYTEMDAGDSLCLIARKRGA